MQSRQRQGENISGAQMHEILREVDVNSNGLVELDEFLQVDINYFALTFCATYTNACCLLQISFPRHFERTGLILYLYNSVDGLHQVWTYHELPLRPVGPRSTKRR